MLAFCFLKLVDKKWYKFGLNFKGYFLKAIIFVIIRKK